MNDCDSLNYINQMLNYKVQMYEATAFWLKDIIYKLVAGGGAVGILSHVMHWKINKKGRK